jgi:hypothetical protein
MSQVLFCGRLIGIGSACSRVLQRQLQKHAEGQMKINRSGWVLLLAPVLRVVLPGVLLAQMVLAQDQENTMFGTWALDVSSSTYHNHQAPENQTRIYEPHANGVKATIITLDATGKETVVSYVAEFDDMPHPLSGQPDADAIVLKQVNPATILMSFVQSGKVTTTAEQVIADTGIKMTITSKAGEVVISEEFFDKVLE